MMRRLLYFSRRNLWEILRDPLSLFFAVIFPVTLLLLMSLLHRSLPAGATDAFSAQKLVPAMSIFSLSFLSLFSAMLLCRDRSRAFLLRLYASPLRAHEFLLGYALPLLPIALLQQLVCFGFGALLGLPLGIATLQCLLLNLPMVLVHIAIGLLCGSLLSDRSVGGVCGALMTNLSAWLSGAWFDLELIGGRFAAFARLLPFSHGVDLARAAALGQGAQQLSHLLPICLWALGLMALAVAAFAWQRRRA